MSAPREIKQGSRVQFVDNDGTMRNGSVNGEPWVYFQPATLEMHEGVHARIPVYVDDGRTLDVAGHNVRDVS